MMMARMKSVVILFFLVLAGCGIPPVDTTFISSTPANEERFEIAKRAVRACSDLTESTQVRRNFRNEGFDVSVQEVTARTGRTVSRTTIVAPDDAVSVLYLGNSCYVGLVDMTPLQSKQLAQIWVDAHNAEPNSAFGDGLSDHVSGAWRRFFTEPPRIPSKAAYSHKIYIAAYKTWPHGPYDPKRQVGYQIPDFPKKPGAAVRLNHVIECRPQFQTGPRSGAFLPCSGPEYRPNQ